MSNGLLQIVDHIIYRFIVVLVSIKAQSTADEGQIIVALLDDENATLKRYYPHLNDGYVILRAENEAYEDQVIDLKKHNLVIQGIAIKVIKDVL